MDYKMDLSKRIGFPFGFLGAIVLIMAVEHAIVHLKMASLGGSQWDYEVARTKADSGDPKCKILCFGDSLLKQGLAPTVIEAKSGLPAYNFAITGGQAPGNYFLFRRALESGIRPSAILVEYLPKLMSQNVDFNVENWAFVASPSESLELARVSRDAVQVGDLVLREFLPSFRCRLSIRQNFQFALSGTFPIVEKEILSARRNWTVNRGAQIQPSRPGRIEDIDTWMRGYFPEFHCSSANQFYIEKLLNLASRHEIPVFWMLPPYKPELQARCEQSGFDAVHEAYIRSMQARFPGLYVIDGRHAGYDPAVFTDLHHLGREGAAIFSAEVASLLRRYHDNPAATPHWLKLANYRALTRIEPLEDMDESRKRIGELAAKNADSRVR